MQKLRIWQKFQDFLFRNRLRSFIYKVALPYFARGFLWFLMILLLGFFALQILKPQFLQKSYKRFSNYFLTRLDLDNYAFLEIEVEGVKRADKKRVVRLVKKTKNLYKNKDSSLIEEIAKAIKEDQPWVKKVKVFRSLPNKINIAIEEYIPFAIWQKNGEKFVVDRQGNRVKIDDDAEFDYLIVLSGKGAFLHASSLFNLLATNPALSSDIYSANFVGERRWDLRFGNGLLVKLPADNLEKRWRDLDEIYRSKGALINLKIIDLRLDNKTYLEYK